MKRRWMLVCMVLLAAVLLCACGRQESPAEDFKIEMRDGQVVITGYIGTDREIVIPEKIANREVTIIGDYAFEGYDLVSVDFPDTLKEIGEGAFYRCKCLLAVKVPASVEKIGAGAFNSCRELSELKLPEDVVIGEAAFGNCKKLDKQEAEAYPVKTVDRWYSSDGEIESEQILKYTYQFDYAGRCVSYICDEGDGNQIKCVNTYDTEGNVVFQLCNTADYEIVYTYEYDEQGNLLTHTTKYPENHPAATKIIETIYTYDEDGRVLRTAYFYDGEKDAEYEWIYDKWKLVKVRQSARAYQTIEFDWRGREIKNNFYRDGVLSSIYEYTYDEAGRHIATQVTGENGNIRHTRENFYE